MCVVVCVVCVCVCARTRVCVHAFMMLLPASGLVGFSRVCNGDVFEVQLKLSNQKWKARCRVERQQQVWQDNDVSSNQTLHHLLPNFKSCIDCFHWTNYGRINCKGY